MQRAALSGLIEDCLNENLGLAYQCLYSLRRDDFHELTVGLKIKLHIVLADILLAKCDFIDIVQNHPNREAKELWRFHINCAKRLAKKQSDQEDLVKIENAHQILWNNLDKKYKSVINDKLEHDGQLLAKRLKEIRAIDDPASRLTQFQDMLALFQTQIDDLYKEQLTPFVALKLCSFHQLRARILTQKWVCIADDGLKSSDMRNYLADKQVFQDHIIKATALFFKLKHTELSLEESALAIIKEGAATWVKVDARFQSLTSSSYASLPVLSLMSASIISNIEQKPERQPQKMTIVIDSDLAMTVPVEESDAVQKQEFSSATPSFRKGATNNK